MSEYHFIQSTNNESSVTFSIMVSVQFESEQIEHPSSPKLYVTQNGFTTFWDEHVFVGQSHWFPIAKAPKQRNPTYKNQYIVK